MNSNNKILAMLIAIAIMLSACSPTITRDTAEKELVSFMLDYIVEQEIGGTANYILTSGQAWVEAPPSSNIIIWADPIKDIDGWLK